MKTLSTIEAQQVSAGWKPGDLLRKIHHFLMRHSVPYIPATSENDQYAFTPFQHYIT